MSRAGFNNQSVAVYRQPGSECIILGNEINLEKALFNMFGNEYGGSLEGKAYNFFGITLPGGRGAKHVA